MSLTTVAQVKAHLGITDTSEDTFLTQLLPAVESAFANLIDRQLAQQTYTDFYNGNNSRILPLSEYPATPPVLTGTLTSGSPTVTGFTATGALGAGLTVTGTGITAATTVLSVDSATQVTLSANATASGAQSLTFGPTVYSDPTAFWGTVANSFAPNTLLTQGVDYALVLDGRGAAAEVGRLFFILGVWPGRFESKRGLLATAARRGAGNIKVTYVAGYASIPLDVQLCLWQVCAQLRADRKRGRTMQSESFEGYNYALEQQALEWMNTGSTAQVLARYKRIAPRLGTLTY